MTISLCMAGHYFSHPDSTSDHVPCLQSVGISLCLPLCCPCISFFYRPLLLVPETSRLSDFAQMWLGFRLKRGQTTFVFQESFNRFYVCLLPDVFIPGVVQPGLPSCPSQHPRTIIIGYSLVHSGWYFEMTGNIKGCRFVTDCTTLNLRLQFIFGVRTHPRKPGKYWNLIITIPSLECTEISANVLENSGILSYVNTAGLLKVKDEEFASLKLHEHLQMQWKNRLQMWSFTHFIPSPQPTRATALPGCLPILAS